MSDSLKTPGLEEAIDRSVGKAVDEFAQGLASGEASEQDVDDFLRLFPNPTIVRDKLRERLGALPRPEPIPHIVEKNPVQ